MLQDEEIRALIGSTAYDETGEKVGKVGQLFLDDSNGEPEFVTVNTGLFGSRESFVPVQRATLDGDRLLLPFSKDMIKDAPSIDAEEGHIDEAEEDRLFDYYRSPQSADLSDTAERREPGNTRARATASEGEQIADRDLEASDTADEADRNVRHQDSTIGADERGTGDEASLTRSEEHLEVGTERREAGRARLRKYVTTETETVTVPVRKEKAVLETEPITADDSTTPGDRPDIAEEDQEVILSEERPVVQTVAEPVEKVRLTTETRTEEETVSGEVRKEHVDVEGDVDEEAEH